MKIVYLTVPSVYIEKLALENVLEILIWAYCTLFSCTNGNVLSKSC